MVQKNYRSSKEDQGGAGADDGDELKLVVVAQEGEDTGPPQTGQSPDRQGQAPRLFAERVYTDRGKEEGDGRGQGYNTGEAPSPRSREYQSETHLETDPDGSKEED